MRCAFSVRFRKVKACRFSSIAEVKIIAVAPSGPSSPITGRATSRMELVSFSNVIGILMLYPELRTVTSRRREFRHLEEYDGYYQDCSLEWGEVQEF